MHFPPVIDFPPSLSMMHLCITQCLYWMPLCICHGRMVEGLQDLKRISLFFVLLCVTLLGLYLLSLPKILLQHKLIGVI